MLKVQRKQILNWLPYSLALLGLAISTVAIFSFLMPSESPSAPVDIMLNQLRTEADRQIELIQDRLGVVPEDQEGYLKLGGSYLKKARETGDPSYYARAEAALLEVLALDPDNATAMLLMGSLSLSRHEFNAAMDWANRSLEINSQVAPPYGVLGDAQVELGLYDEGFESYQIMVDIEPSLDSYARASYARKLTGDIEGAIEAMQLAVLAGSPKSEAKAWTLVQTGDLYLNSGDIDKAFVYYEDALKEFNGYHIALAGLGKVRAAQGRLDEAIELYQKAVAVIPHPVYLAALGDLYAKIGDLKNAKLQYDTVELIARLQSLNKIIYNRDLSLFYANHEMNLEASLELAQNELQARKDIYGYDALAWALYKNGRLNEAAAASDNAMKLGTQDPNLFFHAGMIQRALGNDQKALDYLEHALDLNPHFSFLYADEARSIVSELRGESVK